ncbi:MAG: phosphoserine transaminase [Caulobacterales bacterium]|nr:phosphoserine transaminase [Caulobacterales bacterium]
MTRCPRPQLKPARPWFSSGPTAKPPGWRMQDLSSDLMGRNIRADDVQARFDHAHALTRQILEIPADHALCFLPASDTGAVEAALWNLLGERPVQVLAYDNFGQLWASDVRDHLGLDAEVLEAPYGALPDLARVRPDCDVVFAWNGTTSGVRVPDGTFISPDRSGLTICDATSAAFCMPLAWDRLDVVTFSFQKALGGDAGIGAMVLSPRAIARLDRFVPPRAIPKILRLRGPGGFDRKLATGAPINTYSILTLEDWIAALEWAQEIGGLQALIGRTRSNFQALSAWVGAAPWVDFLARNPGSRSETSVCLSFADPEAATRAFVGRFCALLAEEGVAFDVESHRAAPAGLRIWCGATVETADIVAVGPWLDWAWSELTA